MFLPFLVEAFRLHSFNTQNKSTLSLTFFKYWQSINTFPLFHCSICVYKRHSSELHGFRILLAFLPPFCRSDKNTFLCSNFHSTHLFQTISVHQLPSLFSWGLEHHYHTYLILSSQVSPSKLLVSCCLSLNWQQPYYIIFCNAVFTNKCHISGAIAPEPSSQGLD